LRASQYHVTLTKEAVCSVVASTHRNQCVNVQDDITPNFATTKFRIKKHCRSLANHYVIEVDRVYVSTDNDVKSAFFS